MQGQDNGAKRIDVLVALWLVVLAAILMRLPGGAQDAMGEALRRSALRPFVFVNTTYAQVRMAVRDLDLLRARMDSLLSRTTAQRTLALENLQLRGLLELRESSPRRYVTTPVIRAGTTHPSAFRVSAGLDDGVRPFDAVVTEVGLLGQIQRAGARSALAYDWSHPDFRVSAMTTDGRVHGFVMADRGGFREQDRLLLDGTAYLSDLEPGTQLVTTGRGGTYARGILVGWVSGVADTRAGWSKTYHVEPAVQPGIAAYAFVDLGEPALPGLDAPAAADEAPPESPDTGGAVPDGARPPEAGGHGAPEAAPFEAARR